MPQAIVTGGNRGIGLEVCRQLAGADVQVLLTARNDAAGTDAAGTLKAEGHSVAFGHLNLSDPGSIAEFAEQFPPEDSRIDILINNAGVALEGFNANVVKQTLAVNFFGALRLTDALLPGMSPTGRIVMVSSGMGALSCLSSGKQAEFLDPALNRERLTVLAEEFLSAVIRGDYRSKGWPGSAYNVSKVLLNAYTRILAGELAGSQRRVNAVCPGWVRTRMGGSSAPTSVEQAADTIVWAALLPADGPQGAFLRERKPIPW